MHDKLKILEHSNLIQLRATDETHIIFNFRHL